MRESVLLRPVFFSPAPVPWGRDESPMWGAVLCIAGHRTVPPGSDPRKVSSPQRPAGTPSRTADITECLLGAAAPPVEHGVSPRGVPAARPRRVTLHQMWKRRGATTLWPDDMRHNQGWTRWPGSPVPSQRAPRIQPGRHLQRQLRQRPTRLRNEDVQVGPVPPAASQARARPSRGSPALQGPTQGPGGRGQVTGAPGGWPVGRHRHRCPQRRGLAGRVGGSVVLWAHPQFLQDSLSDGPCAGGWAG